MAEQSTQANGAQNNADTQGNAFVDVQGASLGSFADYEKMRLENKNVTIHLTDPNATGNADAGGANGQGQSDQQTAGDQGAASTKAPDKTQTDQNTQQAAGTQGGQDGNQAQTGDQGGDQKTGTEQSGKQELDADAISRGVKNRLQRQQRKHTKETGELQSRIDQLNGELESVRRAQRTQSQQSAQGDGQAAGEQTAGDGGEKTDTPYPDINDYGGDFDRWLSDIEHWGAGEDDKIQGGTAQQSQQGQQQQTAGRQSQNQQSRQTQNQQAGDQGQNAEDQRYWQGLVNDFQETVDSDTSVSETLWDNFMEGYQSGKVHMTDPMLEVLANEESVVDIAPKVLEKFVEKPVLSRRIARKTPEEQVKAVLAIVAEIQNPGNDTGGNQSQQTDKTKQGNADTVPDLQPVNKAQAGGDGEVDIYSSDLNFAQYERERNKQEAAKRSGLVTDRGMASTFRSPY